MLNNRFLNIQIEMKTSELAKNKIKSFEGLSLSAYKCAGGVLTIGYGHTKGVKYGQKISLKEAESLFLQDISIAEIGINKLNLKLNQGQFDALVSFVFNLGLLKLKNSTLLKYVRFCPESDLVGNEFEKWVYAGGRKLDGLVNRRAWEKERYYSHFCRLF